MIALVCHYQISRVAFKPSSMLLGPSAMQSWCEVCTGVYSALGLKTRCQTCCCRSLCLGGLNAL